MALLDSSCSQLPWTLWHWESPPLCKGPWVVSFPLVLPAPPGILKHVHSFLFDFEGQLRLGSPSVTACCVSSACSSSPLAFADERDSCDLDSPLMIILKWDVRVLSESSGFSWKQFSCEASPLAACCVLTSSGCLGGELYWEMTICGSGEPFWTGGELQWFFTARGIDSGCGTVSSLGTSVCRLEFCKENKNNLDVTYSRPGGNSLHN